MMMSNQPVTDQNGLLFLYLIVVILCPGNPYPSHPTNSALSNGYKLISENPKHFQNISLSLLLIYADDCEEENE